MSAAEEACKHNSIQAEERRKADAEHIAEIQKKNIADMLLQQKNVYVVPTISVKEAWDNRIARRKKFVEVKATT